MNRFKIFSKYIAVSAVGLAGFQLISEQRNNPKRTFAKELENKKELVGVILVGRHGARTPFKDNIISGIEEAEYKSEWLEPIVKAKFELKTLKNEILTDKEIDSYEYLQNKDKMNVLKGGAYHGQLTFIGEQQLFDLGTRLRKRYIDELNFLSAEYDPSEISIRSTNVKRCINSAKSLLAGLYLNSKHTDDNIPFQIKVGPLDNEYLFPNNYNCPTLSNFDTRLQHILHKDTDHSKDLDLLEYKYNYKRSFISFIDDMHSRIAHSHPLPSGELGSIIEKGSKYATLESHFYMKNNLPLNVGLFLNLINDNLASLATSSKNGTCASPKFYYYSAHDVTLNALLAALDFIDEQDLAWPKYGANLIIELYKSNGNHTIEIRYCEQQYKITSCNLNKEDSCDLSNFLQLISKHSIDHQRYTEMCRVSK